MEISSEADFQSDGWTCPACHNDYSQNTRKLRHLRHCSVIRRKLEEDEEQTSPEEIERLIQHYRAQLTHRKKTRCTCQFGYHFCEEIVGDINWDAEMFLVLVPSRPERCSVTLLHLALYFLILNANRPLPATGKADPQLFFPQEASENG